MSDCRTKPCLILSWLLLSLLGVTASARAAAPLRVEIVESATGRVLPTWHHDGRVHVAGEPGVRYVLRVSNPGPVRRLAVVSVDGVNVVNGETAAYAQSGYVFESGATGNISGWRKSLAETAAFYFTELPDSYAARTGRPTDVGVIGVAVFDEWSPPVAVAPMLGKQAAEASAPAARAADAERMRDEIASATPRLGTGHGERLHSVVTTTAFRRASSTPQQLISIHYDRLSSLIARGIVPPPAVATPNPFPRQFVPDPDA